MSPQADVAIVTANLGGWDDVLPQTRQDIAVDWIYYTDDPELKPPGWEVIRQQSNGVHPCLAAKKFKMLPPVPHRYVIWCDANILIQSPRFAREALKHINDGLAVHTHPFRDCIYVEALESRLADKYDHLPLEEQVKHYEQEGFPHHGGLYACGVIAWDREHPNAQRLGEAWMAECERWSFQDQLSFPVVCWRLGIEPGVFKYSQYKSPWFRICPHPE